MFPPTKRLNYFDHQFLRVDDFSDEQAYHLGMRRAHNRLLHSPGVAQGLAVAHDGSTLAVSPGVALDGQGREIVLKEPVELDAPLDAQTAWVTIAYGESRIDPTTETGAAGDRRWEETPSVRVDTAPPGDPETRLVLARVTLAGGRVTAVDDGTAPVHRRVAGPAAGAELEVRSLAVQRSARVGGALSVGQTLSVGGSTGAAATPQLQVAGGNGDVGATEGDFKVGGDTHRLKVGVTTAGTNAGNVRVRAVGGTGRLMLGAGTRDMISITDRAVGFGTTAPTHPYHFVGDENIALFESTSEETYVRLISTEGMDNRVEFCNRPTGRAAIWVNGAGDALYVERNGEVHVPGKLTAGSITVTSRVQDARIRQEKVATSKISISAVENSATWHDVDGMQMEVASTGGVFLLRFQMGGVQIQGVEHGHAEFQLVVNGTRQAYTLGEHDNPAGWTLRVVSLERLLTLAEGSHAIKVQWRVRSPDIRVAAGTTAEVRATLHGSFYNDHRTLMAIEF